MPLGEHVLHPFQSHQHYLIESRQMRLIIKYIAARGYLIHPNRYLFSIDILPSQNKLGSWNAIAEWWEFICSLKYIGISCNNLTENFAYISTAHGRRSRTANACLRLPVQLVVRNKQLRIMFAVIICTCPEMWPKDGRL